MINNRIKYAKMGIIPTLISFTRSPTGGKLAKAMSLLQGEVEDVKKDKKGYGYNYGDLAQVLKILRPLLVKNSLAVIQFPGFIEDRVSIETLIMHESDEWVCGRLEIPVTVGKGMIPAQACGSTISYGRRYSLFATMGMAAEDDDLGSIAANPISVPPITEEQLTKIRIFVNGDASRINKMCKHYRVNDLAELNVKQASSVLDILSGPSMDIAQVRNKK
jgi:hypothetical protein